jgi:transcriptional regulator with XRE-family HTH domain
MEMQLATRIQALREGLGLTQAKFADTLIVSQGMVSRWEKGKHAPSEHLLSKIASLAGITLAELRYGAKYGPDGGQHDDEAGSGGKPLEVRSKRVRRRITDLLEECVINARSSGKADVATALEVILDKCWADAAHYHKHQRAQDENKKAS